MYGQGFGSLFLQVLLEGEFADNTATAADFGPLYTILGESTTANVAITNAGGTALSSIDYTITTDGVPSAEQHVNLTSPIQFNATGTISITIPADATAGSKVKTFNITKVNGNANSKADVGAKFTLYTLPELVNRNVVVEEFTGTACGWCPRGLIGMENLRKAYGDRFVGIGLHQYNSSDAMYIAPNAYASISFESAPSCRINRGAEIDPYYGTNESILDDFAAEMAVPALAKVNVSGTADADLTTVEAKAEVEALVDNSKFTLEFVVIGDGLTGTGSAWNQANYYYQYNATVQCQSVACRPLYVWYWRQVWQEHRYWLGIQRCSPLQFICRWQQQGSRSGHPGRWREEGGRVHPHPACQDHTEERPAERPALCHCSGC